MIITVSDIVETATTNGSFKTLISAVAAAGLTETLKSKGPFTVFAPSDDAFAKLPAGTVDNLLKAENRAKLVDLLKSHVMSGKVLAKDVSGKKLDPASLQGEKLDVNGMNGGVTVSGAKVTATDIDCANGVIHVIDTVIMPKG